MFYMVGFVGERRKSGGLEGGTEMILQRPASRSRAWRTLLGALPLAAAASLGIAGAPPAQAQMSPFLDGGDPNVRVDYSVLGPGYDAYGEIGRAHV